MLASDVIASVSQDVRSVLGTTGQSQTILLDYTDRIQKDCLHDSIYSYLNRTQQTLTTTVNVPSYTLSGTIRSVVSVYDRTRNRILLPYLDTSAPIPLEQAVSAGGPVAQKPSEAMTLPREILRLKSVSSAQPEYWQYLASNLLVLYATPLAVLNLEVVTEGQVATLTSAGQTLTMPDDSKDMVVAGVNYLANYFLSREQPAQQWVALYSKLKAGESIV